MNCSACGVEVDQQSAFCHKCGAEIHGAQSAAPPAKPEPSATERFRRSLQGETPGDDTLEDYDPEQELWEGGYSPKAMYGTWILLALATLGLVIACFLASPLLPLWLIAIPVIWLIGGGLLAYRRLNVYYTLTSQRFIHKQGILKRVTDRIEVIDMDDVTFEQGIVQRLLGVGNIQITSSDRSHPKLNLMGIDNVVEVADLLDDVRRKERRRRGIHIESI